MKRFIISLLIALFTLIGLATISEATVYSYKYQFVLAANTDGQAASSYYTWSSWNDSWKPGIASSSIDFTNAKDVNIIYDSLTNACTSTDMDLNFTHAIDGSPFTTTKHYYSIDDINLDLIQTVPGGLTPPMKFLKPTMDEDSAGTCTFDLYISFER